MGACSVTGTLNAKQYRCRLCREPGHNAGSCSLRTSPRAKIVYRRYSETHAIREALVAATGRYPRSAMTLFAAVTDEWGPIGERRLWRAIKWLVDAGRLRVVGEHGGYVEVRP